MNSADLLNKTLDDHSAPFRRIFFEGGELPDLEIVERQLSGHSGISIVFRDRAGGRGWSPAWTLKFTFRGYRFLIDMNHHAGCSVFLVDDPACPDEILRDVLAHVPEENRVDSSASGRRALWFVVAAVGAILLVSGLICANAILGGMAPHWNH